MQVIVVLTTLMVTIQLGSGQDPWEENACLQSCMQKSELSATNVAGNETASDEPDITDFSNKQRLLCNIFEELKSCVLKCDGGEKAWERGQRLKGGIVELCGLGIDVTDVICAHECQLVLSTKIQSIFSEETGQSLDLNALLMQNNKICKSRKTHRKCVLNCKGGEKLWELQEAEYKTLCSSEHPDSLSGQICPTNCQQEFAIKSEQIAPPTEGTIPTFSEFEEANQKICELYGDLKSCMLACDGGANYWEDFTNSTEEDNMLISECGQGEDGSIGDFPGQLCAQYCQLQSSDEISKLYPSGLPTINTGAGGGNNDKKVYPRSQELCDVNIKLKACVLDCDGGLAIWKGFEKGSTTQFVDECESGKPFVTISEGKAEPVKTSDTNQEVADYCQGVLDENNGDTSFCKFKSFSQTCKNVCAQK